MTEQDWADRGGTRMRRLELKSLIIALVFISIAFGCKAEIMDVFENQYKDYQVMHYRKGHFTNTKNDEYVVFFRDYNEYKRILKLNPKANSDLITSIKKTINKIVVFQLKNSKIIENFVLKDTEKKFDMFSWGYIEKYHIQRIKKGNPQFGTWDGYCFLYDFNGNGLDEILFFNASGVGFVPYIFEYKNNKMEVILQPDPSIYIMDEIKTINQNNKKIIMIYSYNRQTNRNWYKYLWNSIKQLYVLVEKGVE